MNHRTLVLALSAACAAPLLAQGSSAPASTPALTPAQVQACQRLDAIQKKQKADWAKNAETREQQIKPLEAQMKALIAQDDVERYAALDALAPGDGEAAKGYDQQKAALRDQQEAEIKELRARYDAQIKALPFPKTHFRCK